MNQSMTDPTTNFPASSAETATAVLPPYWPLACAELAAEDPVMEQLMRQYPETVLRTRGDPFQTLVRAIIGQQISVKAADHVWLRFAALSGEVRPENVVALEIGALTSCGLSQRKAEYVADLAGHFLDGRIQPERWQELSDAAVIAELVAVRGIGRWTAEMFLIFHLLRPDVWPVDDIGLQKAVGRYYLEDRRPRPSELQAFGGRYQPWRTVATWYLWRSLDPMVVLY
jgi:DNA-3-methyladenine glycosylase II